MIVGADLGNAGDVIGDIDGGGESWSGLAEIVRADLGARYGMADVGVAIRPGIPIAQSAVARGVEPGRGERGGIEIIDKLAIVAVGDIEACGVVVPALAEPIGAVVGYADFSGVDVGIGDAENGAIKVGGSESVAGAMGGATRQIEIEGAAVGDGRFGVDIVGGVGGVAGWGAGVGRRGGRCGHAYCQRQAKDDHFRRFHRDLLKGQEIFHNDDQRDHRIFRSAEMWTSQLTKDQTWSLRVFSSGGGTG